MQSIYVDTPRKKIRIELGRVLHTDSALTSTPTRFGKEFSTREVVFRGGERRTSGSQF